MIHDLQTCMCDGCITLRVRNEVQLREAAKQASAYSERRGGEPKGSDLQDALRERSAQQRP